MMSSSAGTESTAAGQDTTFFGPIFDFVKRARLAHDERHQRTTAVEPSMDESLSAKPVLPERSLQGSTRVPIW